MNDSLGDRIKKYELAYDFRAPIRSPLILRLDGRSFSRLTKKLKCKKPFDEDFISVMDEVAIYLCGNIDSAQMAYVQSDEINILLHGYKTIKTQPWFDNRIQKITSVSAALASSCFTRYYIEKYSEPIAFDARVFLVPENDVCNAFYWRQIDWHRNSIQMMAQSLYSHKQLHKKNSSALLDMIHEKGKNWNDLPGYLKRGRCCIKTKNNDRSFWIIDPDIPDFSKDRNYIEKHLAKEN